MTILLNGDPVDAMSIIVSKAKAYDEVGIFWLYLHIF
jgi:translation elongation factor EF-4